MRTSSLQDAITSPLFRSIRCQLPAHENLLRPCVIIDKPEVSRNAISEHGAYFTHEGAEIIYKDLAYEIEQYSKKYGNIADSLWEKYFQHKKE
jgi:hypothetical protein